MRRLGFVLLMNTVLVLSVAPSAPVQQSEYGEVSFANSGSLAAQSAFLQGLAQLHNFEYSDSAKHFREAEQIDPSFAMAFWGEAMTKNHPIWMEQDLDAARQVLSRLGSTSQVRMAKAGTQREKDYLQAVEILYGDGSKEVRDFRYADAMAKLHEEYPNDVDGAALYALALLGTAHNGRDIPIYMRAAAILEDLFYANPRHPGAAHYLIHSFDDPEHSPLGLRAARVYSTIAPTAAHAQHMTSHIFLALGMWDDVVRANEAAVALSNRTMVLMGGAPRSCGHYNFWLEYGYLQEGRFKDANQKLARCRDEALHMPTVTHLNATADTERSSASSFVKMRSRYLLDTEKWSDEAVDWNVELGDSPLPQFGYEFATGFAAAQRNDLATARKSLQILGELARKIDPLFNQMGLPSSAWERKLPLVEQQQLVALILAGEGKSEQAVFILQEAAVLEASFPFGFGPPVVDKPSQELLGEVFLKLQRPADARKAFEMSLARAPDRTKSLVGLMLAFRALGDQVGMQETAAKLRKIWRNADPDFGPIP
jgi:tetratricopeptide (TPR) repeat protein